MYWKRRLKLQKTVKVVSCTMLIYMTVHVFSKCFAMQEQGGEIQVKKELGLRLQWQFRLTHQITSFINVMKSSVSSRQQKACTAGWVWQNDARANFLYDLLHACHPAGRFHQQFLNHFIYIDQSQDISLTKQISNSLLRQQGQKFSAQFHILYPGCNT